MLKKQEIYMTEWINSQTYKPCTDYGRRWEKNVADAGKVHRQEALVVQYIDNKHPCFNRLSTTKRLQTSFQVIIQSERWDTYFIDQFLSVYQLLSNILFTYPYFLKINDNSLDSLFHMRWML